MKHHICRYLLVLATGCMLWACAKPDPTVILGNWKADAFAIDSLKVPIAPNIEVTRNQLILKTPDGLALQALSLSAIRAERNTIELEIKDALGVSLVFTIENPGRIHFKVPFVNRDIAFSKQ
ncbi:MAG: hypothetical protein LCH89_09360 [Proteobacteria bacterium]|nr:hypothetical protein [Pseudomonadota bacterium]